MSFKTLYQTGALGPGSDLWIMPSLSQSHWTSQIDWYLNFQISRAKLHRSHQIDQGLREMVQEYELDALLPKELPPGPLMISSQGRLPSHQVIELPAKDSNENWIQSAYSTWASIGKPALRLFLPPGLDPKEVSSYWPDEQTSLAMTLVPDPRSHGS